MLFFLWLESHDCWHRGSAARAVVGGKVSSPLLADEREAVQKKTFTKWVNSHLARVSCRITDLYADLRDGRMLIKLLEVLSGERLVSGNVVKGLTPWVGKGF